MSFLKRLWQRYGVNPFDLLLRRAEKRGQSRFLICWNRGLGDIPLGLYALVHRIREFIPSAEITFLTREDLADGFRLLEGVSVLVDPRWKRGIAFEVDSDRVPLAYFDVILKHPDPTGWLMWQIGKLTPRLQWKQDWNCLAERFRLDPQKIYIGVHVQTQTQYAYEKNWPLDYWRELFAALPEEYRVLLFGFASTTEIQGRSVIDLRGNTSLLEMLSLIKNHCRYLIVPDSGVLSMVYYLDDSYPIDVISLWSDPEQGVLKQAVCSPNPWLEHLPLIAQHRDLSTIPVTTVLDALLTRRLS